MRKSKIIKNQREMIKDLFDENCKLTDRIKAKDELIQKLVKALDGKCIRYT